MVKRVGDKLVGMTGLPLTDSGVKHISQLDPTRRAMADQSTREALLAIVSTQKGGVVTIPVADLNRIAETHALVIEVGSEVVTFRAEKATKRGLKLG